jgi:hypothetical protein
MAIIVHDHYHGWVIEKDQKAARELRDLANEYEIQILKSREPIYNPPDPIKDMRLGQSGNSGPGPHCPGVKVIPDNPPKERTIGYGNTDKEVLIDKYPSEIPHSWWKVLPDFLSCHDPVLKGGRWWVVNRYGIKAYLFSAYYRKVKQANGKYLFVKEARGVRGSIRITEGTIEPTETQKSLLPQRINHEDWQLECSDPWTISVKHGDYEFWFDEVNLKKYYQYNASTLVYEKKDTKMLELYTVIAGDHSGKFVTKLCQNSAGLYVVEVRGTGEVFSVAARDLEKIMPYTVDVRYFGGNTQKYSFFANKDDVKVGDVIVSNNYNNLMLVAAVDTKSPKATTWLTGSVVSASKVLEAPAD